MTLAGRFLEQFQQGIGGGDVHLIHRVDDGHALPAIGGGQGEIAFHLAHFIHRDVGAQAVGLFVIGAAQEEQAGFGQGAQAVGDGVVVGDVERGGRRRGEHAAVVGRGQQEAGQTPGEGGLAHAARAGDQPGVVQAASVVGGQEGLFGAGLADAGGRCRAGCGAPSMRSGSGRVGIGSCWARWARAMRVTSAATSAGSASPLMTRKRGWWAARVRKPVAHLGLQVQTHILEPHFMPGAGLGAAKAEGGVDVDQEGQVGFDADHQGVQLVHGGGQIAARNALIHAGAVGETVGDHDLAAREGRADGLFQMVAAGGGEEQDLGFGGPAVGVAFQHQAADFLGPRAAAGFAGQGDGVAQAAQGIGQEAGLGRFARAVDAFKAKETGPPSQTPIAAAQVGEGHHHAVHETGGADIGGGHQVDGWSGISGRWTISSASLVPLTIGALIGPV